MSDEAAIQAFRVSLVQELKDVDWDILGTYLKLSESEIKEIERDHQATARRRIVMLDKWLKKEDNPSWMMITAALEQMSENYLARQLKKKYLCQQDKNPPMTRRSDTSERASEKVLKLDRKDLVARELESLKETHLQLRDSGETALEAVNPSSRKLKRFSQSYCNRVVSTVEELFDCVSEFFFLNYALLERIISHFLKKAKPVVNSLDDYIQQLTHFKSSDMTCECDKYVNMYMCTSGYVKQISQIGQREKVKEALYIKRTDKTVNLNQGYYVTCHCLAWLLNIAVYCSLCYCYSSFFSCRFI